MMKKSLILLVILLLGFSFVIGVAPDSVGQLGQGESSDTDIPEVPDTDGCVYDSQCDGYACKPVSYVCYTSCSSDSQCNEDGGYVCLNSACTLVIGSDHTYNCYDYTICEGNFACNLDQGSTVGNCYTSCTADSECVEGYICNSGANSCIADLSVDCGNYAQYHDRCYTSCTTDSQCAEGYSCVNSACVLPSSTETNTECNDGVDNNGNGLIDYSEELGCVSANDNYEDYGCNDGIDNDGDGYVDYGNRIILAGTDSSGIKIKENFMCNSENELWIPWYIRDYINDEGYLSGLIAGEDCEEQCSLIQDYYDGTLTYENYVYTVSCTYYSGDPSCSCTRDNYEDNSNSEEIDCGVSTNTETGDVGCTSNDDCSDGYTCDFKNGVCYDYCNSQVQCKLYYACDAQGDADGSCRTFCGLLVSQCSDGVDNDYVEGVLSDGTDYPDDPECRSKLDTDESLDPQCADGIDNDYFAKETTTPSDGIDYPNDPQCLSPEDDSEGIVLAAAPEVSGGFFSRILDFILFWE